MHPGKDGQRTDIFTNGFSGANSADDCSVILNDNSMRSPDLTNTVIFPSLHGEKKPDDEPSSYLSLLQRSALALLLPYSYKKLCSFFQGFPQQNFQHKKRS